MVKNTEINNYYSENLELSDSVDVLDFQGIVKDNVDCNSDTLSSGSEIMQIEIEDALADLDKWRDVTEELDIPDRIRFSMLSKVIGP